MGVPRKRSSGSEVDPQLYSFTATDAEVVSLEVGARGARRPGRRRGSGGCYPSSGKKGSEEGVGAHRPAVHRTDLKVSRKSSVNSCGCSQAAKWVPLSWLL